MVIKDHKHKNYLLGMPVSSDKNISFKKYDRVSKSKDFEIEQMWHLKTTVIPIIIRDPGMTQKSRDKHIKIAGSNLFTRG